MTYYETTLVVDSMLDEPALKAKVQHYLDEFVDHGAEILHLDHRGVRKLAYDIKGKDGAWRSQADYTFIHYIAPGTAVSPVEALMKLDEDVLRFMTVRPRFQPDFESLKYDDDSGTDAEEEKTNNDTSADDDAIPVDSDDDDSDDSDEEEE